MDKIHVTARLTIKPGKLEECRTVAALFRERIIGKTPGTLQYDWFINAEETECIVQECYRDSQAIFDHLANLGDAFPKLLEVCDMDLTFCGSPSAELLEFLKDLDFKLYAPLP